jgi:hypothetical protein
VGTKKTAARPNVEIRQGASEVPPDLVPRLF